MKWTKKPAIVCYKGVSCDDFTFDKQYEAFFLEYWEGERNSLHVRNNLGVITDYNSFKNFEVVSDVDNILNYNEAVVRCITHKYSNAVSGLTYNKEYKAIGCDRDGLYLVMDNSYDCYFYPPEAFEIIEDKYGILQYRSVYYSFYQRSDEIYFLY